MARKNGQHLRELQGPLLPLKDLAEVDDDFLLEVAEEDEDQGFVDAEELCGGGLKPGSLPGGVHVIILNESTQEKCKAFGRFPITGVWWRVKVRAKPVGSANYRVQGLPSYFLQTDMSPPNQKEICSLFLTECQVTSDKIGRFLKWVEEDSSYEDLNFENLTEKLRTFERKVERKEDNPPVQSEEGEPAPDHEPCLPVEGTDPYKYMMIGLQFPKIMEFLPVLLPRHFKQLISSHSKEEVLDKIEGILGSNPWKLGFRRITYLELRLVQCEASWMAFRQCSPLLRLMTDLQKNALIIYSKLKQICQEHGHTCVEEAGLNLELSKQMSFQDVWESLKFLKDIGVVILEKGRVFLYDLYQAEKGIASSICELMKRPPWCLDVDVKKVLASIHTIKPEDAERDDATDESKPDDTRLESSVDTAGRQDSDCCIGNDGEDDVSVDANEAHLDPDQVAALEMICSNAVTVISGKGGCGKTTIVSRLFKYIEQLEEREVKNACKDFEQDQGVPEEWNTFTEESQQKADKAIEVLLTAPTGKATGLLREKTGLPAYTLYQVNYSYYLWKKDSVSKNKPWKFSSVRVLVVDEGSLVSVGIFKSVLNLLCEHSKLSKLIILGDVRQLPSIEPGNLLKDIFETLKPRNCAIELKTNHRAESQLIVDNATRISRRQFPNFDAAVPVTDNPTFPISMQHKTFIFVKLPEEDGCSQLSRSSHHSYLYSAVKALLQEKDFASAKTSQFIAFRRQDCDLVNDCCCKHYTGHLTKDHQKRLVFGIGDKICCTRNAYLSDVLPDSASKSQQNNDLDPQAAPHDGARNKHDLDSSIRLCNGEIYFITNDVADWTSSKRRSLTISNMAGLEVTVDFKKLMKHCHIKHAWARTIHTFQGSEEHTVAYVVGKAGRQHWQHVYTAVTRGRCRVYVIAEESQLQAAIRRNDVTRKTRLKHFLQNKLSDDLLASQCSPSPSRSTGDHREDSTEPAAPRPAASPLPMWKWNVETSDLSGSRDSLADCNIHDDEIWDLPSLEEVDKDEHLRQSRGSKRGCGLKESESPNKVLMVGESPQVSSVFQNLKLNSLARRQLFKPTENQQT
ncbi:DNA helicase B isoform X1 [Ochotona curzoniae]|uniref:DNA helicase B isoform X1 n=1 Tax=Ochotona curzoniae TaxID=130825 RepID=UPI001B349903|nr:DNA helicase B isoform X1 [Ochotona curzoniae]